MSELLLSAGEGLLNATRILVVSHIRPDGDAIGSLLGLGMSLEAAGKSVQMVIDDPIPATFRHLLGDHKVKTHPEGSFDLACVVDCSDLLRTGAALEAYGQPDLNLDHHITNLAFARLNVVDSKAVATAEMVYDLLVAVGLNIPQPAAAALLTGLITDTLGFRTSNMTPKALHTAAALMEHGADLAELYRRALITRSYQAARLWGEGLSRLTREGRLIWTSLTLADRQAAGYPGKDDADLINVLSAVDEADISMIFVESANGRTKVSWRAQPPFDVSALALQFGGGGHPAASGAEVPGSLEQVREQILQATRILWKEQSSNPKR